MPKKEWWSTIVRKAKVAANVFGHAVSDNMLDRDFQVQRLTQATLLAVARYSVHPLPAQVVNIVASKRAADNSALDTRNCWQGLGGEGSCAIYIPAENSGRLLVSPHVEALVEYLQPYLKENSRLSAPSDQTFNNTHRAA